MLKKVETDVLTPERVVDETYWTGDVLSRWNPQRSFIQFVDTQAKLVRKLESGHIEVDVRPIVSTTALAFDDAISSGWNDYDNIEEYIADLRQTGAMTDEEIGMSIPRSICRFEDLDNELRETALRLVVTFRDLRTAHGWRLVARHNRGSRGVALRALNVDRALWVQSTAEPEDDEKAQPGIIHRLMTWVLPSIDPSMG